MSGSLRNRSVPALFAFPLLTLALAGCSGDAPGSVREAEAAGSASARVDAPPAPYTYPPPVQGHYAEVNTGEFDLVDGLAWSDPSGGRYLYVTSAAIASPLLDPACPMAEARALTILRNAGWVEVSFDASGRSTYFGAGTPLGGTSREKEVGGSYWKVSMDETAAARLTGDVRYRGRGEFRFDLPLVSGKSDDFAESRRMDGGFLREGATEPTSVAAETAYEALRTSARKGDLAAFLRAQGFAPERITAIRGLTGIEDDWKRLASRFLEPGAIESLEPHDGGASIGARGQNPEGKAFYNYYQLVTCGDRLVLGAIGENPQ